ncbi:hypothetical protein DSLASN_06900 [Desulfoluna limicola]|uniref:NodB homology domain-containing protein n=1 Tax=Desulfoluna limicola TaxID=2810562 RepID=A0ABM7PD39_9BACT|nr:hypothetical protein [Desulfoluna limicola]BCS95058.1 hypothetical protein DSLASN_06900 [Desulfoluna limicola]
MKQLLPILLCAALFFGASCVSRPWHRTAGEYVVVQPGPTETLESVAESFGGGEAGLKAIETLNPSELTPRNTPLLVPAKPAYELGIRSDGYQLVPVLTYRWMDGGGDGPDSARVQADLLALETAGCHVLSPDDFLAFIRMDRSIPERSVLLAFEVHQAQEFRALIPHISRPGLTGLLFVAPDVVGTQGALTWEEVTHLASQGFEPSLIPTTEKALSAPAAKESLVGYARRVKEAITSSHALLAGHTKTPLRFAAYPDNQGNSIMASVLASLGMKGIFRLGDGGNPFFCDNLSVVRMDVGARGAEVPVTRYLDTFRRAELAW